MILTDELIDVSNRVRVLRDRVLLKPLSYLHPVLLTPGIEVQKGVIIAVGYGRRERRKVAFKQLEGYRGRTLYFEDGDETGRIKPMQVRIGDVVEFSFRNINRHRF
jgi:Mor family transcriptional regulator